MKYKVTPRGWVVFSIIGILVVYSIFSLLQYLLKDDMNNLSTNKENELSITEKNTDDLTSNENDTTEFIEHESPSVDDEIETELSEDEASDQVEELNLLLSKRDTFYFDKNVAVFSEAHKEILDQWQVWMAENISLSVVIEGHINGYPYYNDEAYGLSIATNRAMILKDYLISLGIDSERVIVEAIGSRNQAIKTEDFSQHYLNRRAIIYFKNPKSQ